MEIMAEKPFFSIPIPCPPYCFCDKENRACGWLRLAGVMSQKGAGQTPARSFAGQSFMVFLGRGVFGK